MTLGMLRSLTHYWPGLLLILAPLSAAAQCPQPGGAVARCVMVDGQSFAHNSEFHDNPFRDGETLLGGHVRGFVRLPLGSEAALSVGAFIDIRAGDEDAFRQVRPVLSLAFDGPNDRLVMGTLESRFEIPPTGPHRRNLHLLLPPIQRDEFTIDRAHETGLQWFHSGSSVESEVWANWQLLNTPQQRERFDAGAVARAKIVGPLSVAGQWHVVHQGGQLFSAGEPVADSNSAALGLTTTLDDAPLFGAVGPRLHGEFTHEFYVVGSRYVPDRNAPEASLSGHGFFYQSTFRIMDWRLYTIQWWARDFVKVEGDPNYGFLNSDGSASPLIGQRRHYGEYGVYREFRPEEAWTLEAGFRLHDPGAGGLDYSFEIRAIYGLEFAF